MWLFEKNNHIGKNNNNNAKTNNRNSTNFILFSIYFINTIENGFYQNENRK